MTDHNNQTITFGTGLVVGAALGGIAALLSTPKSGEENRETLKGTLDNFKQRLDSLELDKKVKGLIGDRNYMQLEEEIRNRLGDIKTAGAKFDEKKYSAIVNDVISHFKEKSADSGEKIDELREKLMENGKHIYANLQNAKDDVKKTMH
jgi:gas vesicle protein